ncbi:phosphate ABC transporter permease subunit PstC [Haloferacaceae archaeon DSL9]
MSSQTDRGLSTPTSVRQDTERDRLMRATFFACASITVLTTVAIFLVLINGAASFFYGSTVLEMLSGALPQKQVTFAEFFGGTRWRPSSSDPGYGILPLINGTLIIVVGSALVSIPIGTATAIYLSEYASPDVRRVLKPILEILAGIPTIVYGFFALSFLTPILIRPLGAALGYDTGIFNAAAGCIVVGIMTIPMVSSLSEDAMSAVPDELRQAGYGLGATKFEVSTQVVFPASISGVFASYILAVSRAIGETMAVTLAAGLQPRMTLNPFESIQTMTAYMVSTAQGEAAYGTINYQSLFAVGIVLFLMTLSMNLLNDYVRRRYREVY